MDLDKDIEKLKKLEKLDGFFNKGWCCDLDEIQSIVTELLEKQQSELETYKKIAEILSQKLLDTYNNRKIFDITNIVCEKMEDRDEYDICRPDVKCTECIIEWAIKEVEKDEL